MIPKILRLFLGAIWLQAVCSAAYSKYYVQSGAEVVPVEYVNYGAPTVITNRQIAALSAPPIGSALPLPNLLSPCVAPCIVPTQTVQGLAPIPSNAKILSYKVPNTPTVAVPNNDEKTSYEYSYVVYDEDTGDRKAQRELSDGSVVQGEYSFIQPDGYIREVKYTADDLTGFNAVVKSFLPDSAFGSEKKKSEAKDNKNEPLPCKDIKSEALKVEPKRDQEEHSETEAHDELSVVPVNDVASELVSTEIPPAQNTEQVFELATRDHSVKQAPGINLQDNKITSQHVVIHIVETPEEHAKHGDHPAVVTVYPAKDTVSQNVEKEQPLAVELIPTPNKKDNDENTRTHEAVQDSNPQLSFPNGLAYTDIIKCLQAAASKGGNAPNISPLTYIILPGSNKPC